MISLLPAPFFDQRSFLGCMSRLVVLLVLVVVSASPAGAQSLEEIRRTARLDLGPFYVTPAIRLKELGWDSNIFNEVTGEEQSDFTFTLSPKADIWLPFANRALIASTIDLDMVWFATFKDERGVDPLASLDGTLFLSRFTLTGGYEYRATRQRVSNEIDVRTHYVEGTASSALTYAFSPKFSMTLSGDRKTSDVVDDVVYHGENLQQNLNHMTGRVGVTASHKLTALTTFETSVSREADRFVYLPDRDSDSWTVLPRLMLKPRALIRGSAAAGFKWFLPTDPRLPAFRGLVAEGDVSTTLRGATIISANWRRNISYSFSSQTPYYVDNTYGLSIRQSLGRLFDILVTSERSIYNYRELEGAAGTEPSTPGGGLSDSTWNSAGSLGYRLTRDARIGAGVSYWVRRSSTGLNPDYERLQYLISLSYGL
jgi:hypothetical protein